MDNNNNPLTHYNSEGHRLYIKGNQLYPSVTTILSVLPTPQLEKWRQKIGYEAAAKWSKWTSKVGETVHYNCLRYWEKQNPMFSQEVPSFLDSVTSEELDKLAEHTELSNHLFKEFLETYESQIEMVDIETLVYNDEYKYAGRFDFMFKMNGKNCIGDIKTFKQCNDLYLKKVKMQMAAYNKAIVHNDNESNRIGKDWAEEAWVLRIHPYEDDFFGWDFVPVKMNWDGFYDCTKIYNKLFSYENELETKTYFGRN